MSSAGAELRLAKRSDVRSIAVMSRDLIENGLGWSYPPHRIDALLARSDTVGLVATVDTALAGFAIMSYGDERAHLVLLAVRAAHRRHGIGQRMVNWLLETAVTAGIVSVHLELRARNREAYSFYRALRFAETLRLDGYYRGRETAIQMLRVLRTEAFAPVAWRPPTLDPR
jgi:ribosomal-protein-alanine N-acetyltransferase